MNLANYSEFGLIVGAICVSQGLIGSEWLVIIAVALSISMIAASPVASQTNRIYSRWNSFFKNFETNRRLPGDDIIDIGDATIAVFGMGVWGQAFTKICESDTAKVLSELIPMKKMFNTI